METWAPGTMAPLLSVTVPVMLAVSCPNDATAQKSRAARYHVARFMSASERKRLPLLHLRPDATQPASTAVKISPLGYPQIVPNASTPRLPVVIDLSLEWAVTARRWCAQPDEPAGFEPFILP